MFHSSVNFFPSEYAAAAPATISDDEFPKLNALREEARTPCLRRRCSPFLLALTYCLPTVTSWASGALPISPGTFTAMNDPAPAAYPVLDTFSGSGALSANWTNTTSADQGYVPLAQSADTVATSVSGQQGLAIYTGISFTNDQYAQAKFVAHSSAAGSTGVCVRMNAAGSGVCYLADWGLIYSLANGAGTNGIVSGCPIPTSGDTIQLLVVGSTYTCTDLTTGASMSATDATYSTGNPAILVDQRRSTVYALTQFQADCSPSCGNGSSPAAPPPLPPPPPPAPAPAAYPVLDTFSGSGALSANWTNTTSADQGYVSLAQSAGTVAPSVSGQQGLATYTGISFSKDQYAQAKFVAHSSAAGSTGVCVRMNAAGSGVCYLADWGLIYSLANGAGTYGIVSGCPVPASGDTIQLRVVGTTYTCTDLTTGASRSATDTTYSTGDPAILVDQRRSTVYALAQFQADCYPSCSSGSSPVATPTFSPGAGTYSSPQNVTLKSTTSSATIYYTTDGTTPTTSSTVYSGPLTVSSPETIKAIGTAGGYTASAVGSAAYTIVVANPQLTLSATKLRFGSVTVNMATTQSLTVTSKGASPVTVNSVSITGAGFTIVAGTFPLTLPPNQSVTLQVQFKPTTTGSTTGQLTISSDSTTGPTTVVSLSGTGTTGNPQLTVSATSLNFGSVAVNTSTSLTLTLTSTGATQVTVNSDAITGAGFITIGGSFPITLNPTQALALKLQFSPTTAGTVTGQITINSNSVTGSTTVVALNGTGTAVLHEVDLSWGAPTSSPDPVAGYNIYRSTDVGVAQLINSTIDTQTAYLDSAVVSGTTYSYIVKSLDKDNVESVASNQITVTIP